MPHSPPPTAIIHTPKVRLQIVVAFVGLVLLGAKLWAYHLTNSNAILTDALESIVNVVAGFLGLYSLVLAATPRDANHPYGHGKIEFISASIEGLLIAIAGASMIAKAVWGLLYPQPLADLEIGTIIIAITAVVNWLLGAISRQYGTRYHSPALSASGKHLQSDAYSTLGILLGLLLIYISNWQVLDNVIAIIFGAMIAATGYGILRQSIGGIMDEADTELLKTLITLMQQHRRPNWIDIHNLRVIKYGNVLHIDCHLTVPWYFNVRQAHDELDLLRHIVATQLPNPIELFIHTDPCLPQSCPLCSVMQCPHRQEAYQYSIDWSLDNVLENQKHTID